MTQRPPTQRPITGSDAASAPRWDMPTVSGHSVQGRQSGRTVSDLESVSQRAQQEGFAAGHEAGMAAARAEMQQQLDALNNQVARFMAICSTFAQPLKQLDAQVEEQLAGLALTVARHLVRRELRTDPAQVIAIIRETVGLLPASTRDVRVHLHPEDAAIVRERLAEPAAERAWTIVEDPVTTRGGCRVTTDTAHIDARLESRMAAAVQAVLGDDRSRSEA
jgi:flagellar assembly protein FliH